jgi:predicted aspartyl protease
MPGPFSYHSTAIVHPSGRQLDFGWPAPICQATLSHKGNHEIFPALFDTGASRTAIPHRITLEFGLRIMNKDVSVGSAFGDEKKCWLCLVDLSFDGTNFPNHPVLSIPDKEHILIGRDILNRYIANFDGPNRHFSLA